MASHVLGAGVVVAAVVVVVVVVVTSDATVEAAAVDVPLLWAVVVAA
jgi:hypothetical protein